ncbi:MAG: hypothetical protein ACRDRJ_15600 [Streptosporangiaceae bacterium]
MADISGADVRNQFGHLQALDDALAFRLSRVAVPCPDCEAAGSGRCDDHACDLNLIARYRQEHAIASQEMSAARLAAHSAG